MVLNCGKCKVDIGSDVDVILCDECKLHFHLTCTKIKSGDFKKMTTRQIKKWKCDGCKSESSSTADAQETSAVLSAINKLRDDLDARLDTLSGQVNNVERGLDDLKTDITTMKEDIAGLKTSVSQTTEELQNVKAENNSTKTELREIRKAVDDLEQYSRINNLIITGVPVTNKENVYNILANLAMVLGIKYRNEDLSIAHRLGKRNDDPRPPQIVARFVCREVKNLWLTAVRKKKGLSTTELAGQLTPGAIYLSEHLTRRTSELYYQARKRVREHTLHQTWTHDCKVFVRKVSDGAAIRITHLQDLD